MAKGAYMAAKDLPDAREAHNSRPGAVLPGGDAGARGAEQLGEVPDQAGHGRRPHELREGPQPRPDARLGLHEARPRRSPLLRRKLLLQTTPLKCSTSSSNNRLHGKWCIEGRQEARYKHERQQAARLRRGSALQNGHPVIQHAGDVLHILLAGELGHQPLGHLPGHPNKVLGLCGP